MPFRQRSHSLGERRWCTFESVLQGPTLENECMRDIRERYGGLVTARFQVAYFDHSVTDLLCADYHGES